MENLLDRSQINLMLQKGLQVPEDVKANYRKMVGWSWEMFGTFIVMVESMKDIKCPRKAQALYESEQICNGQNESKPEFTLVLDLDETLIRSDTIRKTPLDKEITVKFGNVIEKYFVKVRPYLQDFLQKMSKIFELVVFTASIKEYADKVIDYIDPNGLIKRRFYRDSCTKQNGLFYKDITRVSKELDKVVIIDNSMSGLSLNEDNGLLIKSWYIDSRDEDLKTYAKILTQRVKKGTDIKKTIANLKRNYPNVVLN